jgi:hypothetical protein
MKQKAQTERRQWLWIRFVRRKKPVRDNQSRGVDIHRTLTYQPVVTRISIVLRRNHNALSAA